MEAPPAASALRWPDANGSSAGISATETSGQEGGARPMELPGARRPSGATLAGLAALAGFGAIALGAWALESSVGARDPNVPGGSARVTEAEQVISLLSKPSTQRIPLRGSAGRVVLVVGASGRGVLVLDGLEPALVGKAYQAWVTGPSRKAPAAAALFSGMESVVSLSQLVEPGSSVGVTIERAGGASAPTRGFTLVARRGA